MRIAIDARMYGPAAKGLGTYIQLLIENLEKIDRENEYLILLTGDNYDSYFPQSINFKKIKAPFRWYSVEEQIKMLLLLKKLKPDLTHFPHFNLPIFYSGKYIVTIHDLILYHYHDASATTLSTLKYRVKYPAYKKVIKTAIKKSSEIIAVSNFTKNDILDNFKIQPKKITVIYEGIRNLRKKSSGDDKKTFFKYNISKPYILYVGNAYPHKNLEGLVLIFREILKKCDYQMVCVGRKDVFYKRLAESIKKANIREDRIIITDTVSDEDLYHIYKKAKAYVFPSKYEGFGLPPLEAMSLGVPVASSNRAAMPEILGDACIYFNPENTKEAAGRILILLNNEKMRHKIILKGKERAAQYSWEECAKKTKSVYLSAL